MSESVGAPPTRGVIGLVAVIVGTIAMAWSFVIGVGVALEDGSGGALAYEIVFIVGLALVIAAIVLAIIAIVRARSVLLATITIAIGAVPVLTILGGGLFALVGSH